MSCKLVIPNTFIMCGEDNFNYCSEECMKKNLYILLDKIVSETDMTQRMLLKNNIIKIMNFLYPLKGDI